MQMLVTANSKALAKVHLLKSCKHGKDHHIIIHDMHSLHTYTHMVWYARKHAHIIMYAYNVRTDIYT